MRSKLLVCSLLIVLGACSTSSRSASTSTETHAEAAPGTPTDTPTPSDVLGHIQLHSHTVTIRSSARGVRFDIRTNAGELPASSLTRADFAAQYPALFDTFEEAYAQLDATAD